MFTGFAGVALLIAVVGVAGVLAFSVSARTREFGVRLAIGSTPTHLLTAVLKEGAAIGILGIVAGAIGGGLLARVVGSFVSDVQIPGLVPIAAAAMVLIAAAILASVTRRRGRRVWTSCARCEQNRRRGFAPAAPPATSSLAGTRGPAPFARAHFASLVRGTQSSDLQAREQSAIAPCRPANRTRDQRRCVSTVPCAQPNRRCAWSVSTMVSHENDKNRFRNHHIRRSPFGHETADVVVKHQSRKALRCTSDR